MRRRTLIRSTLALAGAIFAVAACDDSPTDFGPTPSTLTLEKIGGFRAGVEGSQDQEERCDQEGRPVRRDDAGSRAGGRASRRRRDDRAPGATRGRCRRPWCANRRCPPRPCRACRERPSCDRCAWRPPGPSSPLSRERAGWGGCSGVGDERAGVANIEHAIRVGVLLRTTVFILKPIAVLRVIGAFVLKIHDPVPIAIRRGGTAVTRIRRTRACLH